MQPDGDLKSELGYHIHKTFLPVALFKIDIGRTTLYSRKPQPEKESFST